MLKKSLPVLVSLSSLCCGFICILNSIEGKYDIAAWLIILAMVFDSLDGKIARLTKTDSEFGEQLDSLIDIVVFGVAPIILIGQLCEVTYPIVIWIACFCFLSAAALRLAKFNVLCHKEEGPCKFYTGLPTTISGGTIAHLVLLHNYLSESYGIAIILTMIPTITFILSILMISRIRFFNIMAKISVRQGVFPFVLEISGAIVLFYLNPRIALSVGLSTYVIVCGAFGFRKKESISEQVDVTII